MQVASNNNFDIWAIFDYEKKSDLVILLKVKKGL